MKNTGLIASLAVVLLIGGCYIGGYRRGHKEATDGRQALKIDTLYVRDTVRFEKPVPKLVYRRDTMLIPMIDTIRVSDTVYITAEREYKVYEDSLYRAVVSGFRPSLEEIDIYRREKTVTVTAMVVKEQPKWGFGISLGPGLMLDTQGKMHAGAAVVIGLERRF